MTPDIQYVATLPHVREVSLVGKADLAFWAARLREEDLTPLDVDGRALLQALIDSRFQPTHWLVRQDAAHAKSKTYDR